MRIQIEAVGLHLTYDEYAGGGEVPFQLRNMDYVDIVDGGLNMSLEQAEALPQMIAAIQYIVRADWMNDA